jgi:hypothetical protein
VAEERKSTEKSLEMRVAEIEDKLAKLHITEEEMRAYQKVSNLVAGQPETPGTTNYLSPQVCTIIPRSIAVARAVYVPPRQACVAECSCGPCSYYGGEALEFSAHKNSAEDKLAELHITTRTTPGGRRAVQAQGTPYLRLQVCVALSRKGGFGRIGS